MECLQRFGKYQTLKMSDYLTNVQACQLVVPMSITRHECQTLLLCIVFTLGANN